MSSLNCMPPYMYKMCVPSLKPAERWEYTWRIKDLCMIKLKENGTRNHFDDQKTYVTSFAFHYYCTENDISIDD